MRNNWWAKLLRIFGIVFMSLTALFTLLGGAGTTCVALDPTGFDGKFAGIAPFQWLWILFVLLGIAIGVMGIRAVVLLARGTKTAYRNALLVLLLGTGLNVIHLIASRLLRGGSMPVDAVLYTNLLTLVIFLLYRLPGLRQAVDYEKPVNDGKGAGAAVSIALAVSALLVLGVPYLMAPTHTIGAVNYADAWHATLTWIASLLMLGALVRTVYARGIVAHMIGRDHPV
jgi:hypothetical protein